MAFYDAARWYWAVADTPGQVYASARFQFVPTNDAQYVAFLASGSTATACATQSALRDVLNAAGVRFLSEALPPLTDERPRILRARTRLQIASFNVPTATATAVPWDVEVVDPLNVHGVVNPDRIVIPEAGTWLALGGVRFPSNATGYRAAQLRIGAGTIVAETSVGAANGRDTVLPVSDYFQATAGDILRMFVEQNSGGTLACAARVTVLRVE